MSPAEIHTRPVEDYTSRGRELLSVPSPWVTTRKQTVVTADPHYDYDDGAVLGIGLLASVVAFGAWMGSGSVAVLIAACTALGLTLGAAGWAQVLDRRRKRRLRAVMTRLPADLALAWVDWFDCGYSLADDPQGYHAWHVQEERVRETVIALARAARRGEPDTAETDQMRAWLFETARAACLASHERSVVSRPPRPPRRA